MWTCPECDRSFANPHQWHSCLRMALDEHVEAKTGHAVELYRAVEAALRYCGEFRIHPQKTRVAFIARMTFAGVALARRWGDLSLIMTNALSESAFAASSCTARRRRHGCQAVVMSSSSAG